MIRDTNLRSLVKGISWRVIGTIDTFLLAWIFFGRLSIAVPVALAEILTKVLLYFLHERAWNRISWGRHNTKTTHIRSIVKGISWRFFGSVDTFILGLIFSGNPLASFKVSFTEVITKVVLFYLHERLWTAIKWGRFFDQQQVQAK